MKLGQIKEKFNDGFDYAVATVAGDYQRRIEILRKKEEYYKDIKLRYTKHYLFEGKNSESEKLCIQVVKKAGVLQQKVARKICRLDYKSFCKGDKI